MDQTLQEVIDSLKAMALHYGSARAAVKWQLPSGEAITLGWAATWADAEDEEDADG
jgi:hypothetical protein